MPFSFQLPLHAMLWPLPAALGSLINKQLLFSQSFSSALCTTNRASCCEWSFCSQASFGHKQHWVLSPAENSPGFSPCMGVWIPVKQVQCQRQSQNLLLAGVCHCHENSVTLAKTNRAPEEREKGNYQPCQTHTGNYVFFL